MDCPINEKKKGLSRISLPSYTLGEELISSISHAELHVLICQKYFLKLSLRR